MIIYNEIGNPFQIILQQIVMAKNKYLGVFWLQIVNFLPTGEILIIWLQFVNFQNNFERAFEQCAERVEKLVLKIIS